MHYAHAIASGEWQRWCVEDRAPSEDVWRRIVWYHMQPLQTFARATGIVLVPSARSCYRSRAWELSHKRPGSSLHTFPKGTGGACDLVRADGGPIADVLPTIVEYLPHTRIAIYPNNGFVHADYDRPGSATYGSRRLFTCSSPAGSWVYQHSTPPGRIYLPTFPQ